MLCEEGMTQPNLLEMHCPLMSLQAKCVCIMHTSLYNASKTCSTMSTHLVEDNMLTSYANHP
jgi:hypothetical protein